MSISKDFDAMVAEQAGVKPTFRIAGQDFTLRSKLPYSKWNQLLAAMKDPDGDDMAATKQFFTTVLVKADRQRFADLLEIDELDDEDDDDQDDQRIGLEQMGPLMDWVMEHFTGKLRSNTDGSSPGAGSTGQQPNVISLSAKQPANAG